MLQDINVAKSAPFALLAIYQKSMYPPKIFQNPPVLANDVKYTGHFSIEPREMEPSKFTANCAKIAQFTTHNNESCEIRAILVKFLPIPAPKLYPNFLQRITRN